MEIFLTRHGESQGNVDKILQGDHNTPLTKKGVEQAKRLVKRFENEKFDVIYTSGLLRAYNTAELISKEHDNIPLKVLRELNEKSYGIYAGLKKEGTKVEKKGECTWSKTPIGGVSLNDVILRVERALSVILKEKKDCLIVAHEGIVRMIRILLLQIPKDKGYCKVQSPVGNTAVFHYEIKGSEVEILYENCQKHLEEEIKTSHNDV